MSADETLLENVVTIAEIARTYGKYPATVLRDMDTLHDPLIGRKSGGVWLISKLSVIRRYGDPPAGWQASPD